MSWYGLVHFCCKRCNFRFKVPWLLMLLISFLQWAVATMRFVLWNFRLNSDGLWIVSKNWVLWLYEFRWLASINLLFVRWIVFPCMFFSFSFCSEASVVVDPWWVEWVISGVCILFLFFFWLWVTFYCFAGTLLPWSLVDFSLVLFWCFLFLSFFWWTISTF